MEAPSKAAWSPCLWPFPARIPGGLSGSSGCSLEASFHDPFPAWESVSDQLSCQQLNSSHQALAQVPTLRLSARWSAERKAAWAGVVGRRQPCWGRGALLPGPEDGSPAPGGSGSPATPELPRRARGKESELGSVVRVRGLPSPRRPPWISGHGQEGSGPFPKSRPLRTPPVAGRPPGQSPPVRPYRGGPSSKVSPSVDSQVRPLSEAPCRCGAPR